MRDYQDAKADVILKYTPDEARNLKTYGELPESGIYNLCHKSYLYYFVCKFETVGLVHCCFGGNEETGLLYNVES